MADRGGSLTRYAIVIEPWAEKGIYDVWMDEDIAAQVKEMEGIAYCLPCGVSRNSYMVKLDPRYVPEQVLEAINALGIEEAE